MTASVLVDDWPRAPMSIGAARHRGVGNPFAASAALLLLALLLRRPLPKKSSRKNGAAAEGLADDPRAVKLLAEPKEFEDRMLRPRRGRAAISIYSRTWELPKPRGVIVYCHGLNGHGRHAANLWTAHSLLNRGFSVVAVDVEGHGRSGGLHGLVPNLEDDVAGDIAALMLRTKERYPGVPLFLMGTSMGGLSAALTALSVQHAGPGAVLSGVVLQCPLVRPAKQPSTLLHAVARMLALVAPHLALLPHRAGAGSGASGAAAAAARASMLEDKLCYSGRLRIGTGLALLRGAASLGARMAELNTPLLLQHGSDDALVAPTGSRELLAAAASGDKTLIVYDGASHNLLAEGPDTLLAVREDYLSWLEARVDASAVSAAL